MARRICANIGMTPTGFTDTVAFTTSAFPFCLQGQTATQVTNIWEISENGLAASTSSPMAMLLAYDSTIGTGAQTQQAGSIGSDGPMNPATAALASPVGTGNVFATTFPQRSSTAKLMNCSLNAFGGVYFWRANRVEECAQMTGSVATAGSVSLSLSSAVSVTAGLIGSHMIYETLTLFLALTPVISAFFHSGIVPLA
jgi:hypothetical protein